MDPRPASDDASNPRWALSVTLVAAWWLVHWLSSSPLAAQSPEEPATAPLPGETAFDSVEVRLAVVASALEERPRSAPLRLQRLRLLYALSVPEEHRIAEAADEIARIELLGSDRGLDTLLEAYRGALEVVRGKHAFWPHSKVSHVRRGLAELDESVERAPDDVEVRYLRLVSTHYLPFFFRRRDTAREDMAALHRLLLAADGVVPFDVALPASEFLLENAELDADARPILERIAADARRQLDGGGTDRTAVP